MYQGRTVTDTADTVSVSQTVTIPAGMSSPTLSFLHQLGGAYGTGGSSALVVEVDNGTTSTPILTISESSGPHWTHSWSNLSAWAGQSVTVTFTLEQGADAPLSWARIDEVTLGSSYPDLWSALANGAALPGQEVTLALSYGNRAGVSASSVYITQTLPAGVSFVSADVAPISTSPLVWSIGNVPAGSGPVVILVTLKISSSAPPLVYLTSFVEIATIGFELETANNNSQGQIYTGLRVFMPLTLK